MSSDAHYQATAFDDVDTAPLWKRDKPDPNAGFAAYNRSKLLVAACARELAERTRGTGVTVNTLTPGALIPTNIYDEVTGPFAVFVAVMKPVLRTVDEAMPNYLYVCTSPELDGVSGFYFKDRRAAGGRARGARPRAPRRALGLDRAGGRPRPHLTRRMRDQRRPRGRPSSRIDGKPARHCGVGRASVVVIEPRTSHLEDAMTEFPRAAVPGARS